MADDKAALATVIQHGGEFVATASYQSGGETVSWRAEGRISHSGHITMHLVHTHAHRPGPWPPQSCTAVLDPNGKSLEGYATQEGSEQKLAWTLREPQPAAEAALPP